MAEQILTLGSFSWIGDGGFNYHPPGGHSKNTRYDPKNAPFFKRNFDRIYGSESFQRGKQEARETVAKFINSHQNENNTVTDNLEAECRKLEQENVNRANALIRRVKKGPEAIKFKRVQVQAEALADHLRIDRQPEVQATSSDPREDIGDLESDLVKTHVSTSSEN
jgi:hypothetical protein